MLNETIDSLESKIYVINNDFEYREINSIEDGYNTIPTPFAVVSKINKGKTKSFYNDKFFAHSKYIFYDMNLKEITINIANWSLKNVYELEDRSREVIYFISDPTGNIRNLSNLSFNTNWNAYFQINGICLVMKFIKEISIYSSWSYYDLVKENELLKKEIENLKSNINLL